MQLDPGKLLTEREAAAALNVSVACLRRWRRLGFGPSVTRLSRLVRYAPGPLQAYIETNTTLSDADSAAGRSGGSR